MRVASSIPLSISCAVFLVAHATTQADVPPSAGACVRLAAGAVAPAAGLWHPDTVTTTTGATTTTGDSCHLTMAGRPSRATSMQAHPEECTNDAGIAAVRCCDDNGKGFSKVPGCYQERTFNEAKVICEANGKRLCTKSELDQTKGTGCGFDNQRTWTSSGPRGVLISQGGAAVTMAAGAVVPTSGTLCPPPAIPTKPTNGDDSKCSSFGNDCCAPGDEPATCDDGFRPQRYTPCGNPPVAMGMYTCVPLPSTCSLDTITCPDGTTTHRDPAWNCDFVPCAAALTRFTVSQTVMTYDEGLVYCRTKGGSLASIYDVAELDAARVVIATSGRRKAITSAHSDGNGWAWHNGDKWIAGGFPLNTGQVTDQVQGAANHIYSLHSAGESFVWDADGREERHAVLCRDMAGGVPTPAPTPIGPPIGWAEGFCGSLCQHCTELLDRGSRCQGLTVQVSDHLSVKCCHTAA